MSLSPPVFPPSILKEQPKASILISCLDVGNVLSAEVHQERNIHEGFSHSSICLANRVYRQVN